MSDELDQKGFLAVIGDEDVILGFKAFGFMAYPLKEPAEFKAILEEALSNKAAIFLVQEDIYNLVLDEINSYRNLPLPIFIPFSKTLGGILLNNIIKDIRLRATGAF